MKGCSTMLTPRQLLILNIIIERFTKDGEPIGSKTIVEDGSVAASSATIRNEMSILEELDLIEKVHSSSGRVPTVKGYRFYVDNLMKPKQINERERSEIKDYMNSRIFQIKDVFYQSAELISKLTNYTAIVLGPQSNSNRLTGFRIVPLNSQQMMLVIQLDGYEVQSMIFKIPKGLNADHIKQVTNFMNNNLVGEPLTTVYRALKYDLPDMFAQYLEMNWDIPNMLERTLQTYRHELMFVSGKPNILDFTEDMNIAQVKDLYQLLDNEMNLLSLFNSFYEEQLTFDIRIGNEFGEQLLESFSLVTVPYRDEFFGGGLIAVLGPTNMTYDSTLGVIQALKEELLDKLEDFYLE